VKLSLGFQDLDALYNGQFFSNPQAAYSNGRSLGSWTTFPSNIHNDTTSYKFRNGTIRSVSNAAVPTLDLSGITSGQDIFNTFLLPDTDSDNQSSNSTQTTPTSVPTPDPQATAAIMSNYGFPNFVSVAKDNSVGGYFSDNIPDLAILSIRAFTAETGVDGESTDFQMTVQKFLEASKSAGKSRLIIDIRGNPGGASYTGYDTFKQIFPKHKLNHRLQLRVHPAAQVLSKYLSIDNPVTLDEVNPNNNASEALLDQVRGGTSAFNYKIALQNPDGKAYSSLQQFLGPRKIHGDNFTALFSASFSNIAEDEVNGGLVMTGYGDRSNPLPQVFAEEKVVLVSAATLLESFDSLRVDD
jgi:hypothetical protein